MKNKSKMIKMRIPEEKTWLLKKFSELENIVEADKHNAERINTTDINGMTSVHYAAQGHGKDAKLLDTLFSVSGIQINAKDNFGRTALTIAVAIGNVEAVSFLCAHPQIDLFPLDNQGRSLMHYARGNKVIQDILHKWRMNPSEDQQLQRFKAILQKVAQKEEDSGFKNMTKDDMKDENITNQNLQNSNIVHRGAYEIIRKNEKGLKAVITASEDKQLQTKRFKMDSSRFLNKNLPCDNSECQLKRRHRCSGCLQVAYCGKQCSIDNWPRHELQCLNMSTNAEKNSLSEVD